MKNTFLSLIVISVVSHVILSGHLQGFSEPISESGEALSDPYQIGYRLPEDAVVTYPNSNPLRQALRLIPKAAIQNGRLELVGSIPNKSWRDLSFILFEMAEERGLFF